MQKKPDDMRPADDGIRYASDDPADPVHSDAEGWWFWNEVWADRYGPFESEEKARNELRAYARTL